MLPHSPQVIDEKLVPLFKYWNDGIQEGMCYRGELYAHVRSYYPKERLQAYELACEMAQKGVETCVTCSKLRYAVWVNLRSLNASTKKSALTKNTTYSTKKSQLPELVAS